MSNETPQFEFLDDQVDDVRVLTPIGELDMESAPLVRDRLVEVIRDGCQVLVFDCEKLTFIDSNGLSLLAHAHVRMESVGGELRVAALSTRVQRVLELCGLLEMLRVFPTREAAIAGSD